MVTYGGLGVRAGSAQAALEAAGYTNVENGGGYEVSADVASLEQLCTSLEPPTAPSAPSVTSATATAPSEASDAACADDPVYTGAFGYLCADWIGCAMLC